MSSPNKPSPFASLSSKQAWNSHSQIKQDLFVIEHLNGKRDGYFVEFGAGDGKTLSNTWLLEKQFGWRGLLAEPSRHWRNALLDNRSGSIDLRCVWKTTGIQQTFHETQDPFFSSVCETSSPILSTYKVETVTLLDLLGDHDSPLLINYLSMDTEGSESDIVKKFAEDGGFDRYQFETLSIEHNFDPSRRQIVFDILTSHGYQRIHEEISMFDDWYVVKK